jgi:hypothetical protein
MSDVEDRLRRIEKTQQFILQEIAKLSLLETQTNAWVMRQTTETQDPGEILEHQEETVSKYGSAELDRLMQRLSTYLSENE